MAKIKNIHVKQLRSVINQEIKLEGCTVIIIGGNNKGKSTIARALMERFNGVKNENIVNFDYGEGWYRMELTTGEIVNWSIKADGKEKLTISINGEVQKVTKDIMKSLFPKTFNVEEFLNDIPSKQKKILEKLSGLDFFEVDKIIEEETENRTFYNKRLKEEEAKKIMFETHWITEIQDTSLLEKKLNGIETHNANFKLVKDKLEEKNKQLQWYYERIEELKNQLKVCEEQAMQLETEIDKGNIWINNDEKKPKSEEYKLNLKNQIEDIRNNNIAIERNESYLKALHNYSSSQEIIKQALADKAEMLALADMPEGFGFTEDGITYNGLPYDKKHQSTSALYIGALKLAARTIGIVKALHFDASYLDKNGLTQVLEWAESNNLQLLIERPDFEGGDIAYEIIED